MCSKPSNGGEAVTLEEFNKLDCEVLCVLDLGKANSQIVCWRKYESTIIL